MKNESIKKIKVWRYAVPEKKYKIDIEENESGIVSYLEDDAYSIKLFCYGESKKSENKAQVEEILEVTLLNIEIFIKEYETIKERIEEEN